ncbi:polycystin-1-like protein 2 [Lineus longissimus]|uniref:polycystin-1-like protein 2 n=1 Tax=Lineus longissimus TaxID=88925 RepID=UPI00315D0C2C
MFDSNLWFSIFHRPYKSRATRVQRLCCCAAALSLIMLTNAMWFETGPTGSSSALHIGPLRITFRSVFIGFMSSLIIFPPTLAMVQIFCYLLVIACILGGAFFAFFYSLEWGGEKSIKWLSSLFVSVTQNIVLLESIAKMLCFTLVMTCILRLPSEADDKSVEDEFLLTDVADGESNVEIPPVPNLPEKLDNCHETDAERSNRGSNFYHQNKAFKNAFGPRGEVFVNGHADFGYVYNWLKTAAIPMLYPDTYYNGKAMDAHDRLFMNTIDGLRIGPARLRQKRVKEVFCEWENIIRKCVYDYDQGKAEAGDFLTYWRHPIQRPVAKSPFLHTPAHKNDITFTGTFSTYDGGGYVAEFGDSSKTAQLILDQLSETNWMDRLTRAVFLEATIYNANVNLFSCLRISFEMPVIGGIYISTTVESFRPYPYLDNWDLVILILQILWVLVLFYLVYVEVNLVRAFGRQYVLDAWSYVQVLNILTSFSSAILYVIRVAFVIGAIEDVKNNVGEYVSFDKMLQIDEAYTSSLAIISFICIMQVLKPLTLNYFFALLKNIMKRSAHTILSAYIFLFFMWMAFGASAYVVLVHTTAASFRTLPRSLWTLVRLTIGIIKFPEAMGEETTVKRVLFVSFMVVCYIVLFNLIVTIYLEMYTAIRELKTLEGFDYELNEHFWKRIYMLRDAFLKKEESSWSCESNTNGISMLVRSSAADKTASDESLRRRKEQLHKMANMAGYSVKYTGKSVHAWTYDVY